MNRHDNSIIALPEEHLPPLIAGKDVSRLPFGLVNAKTMVNRDSLGTGPKNRFRMGMENSD